MKFYKKIILIIAFVILLVLPCNANNDLTPDELFYNFWGDFYDYILVNGGAIDLVMYGVVDKNSFRTFVETNGGIEDAQGFGRVGDLCGEYWAMPNTMESGFLNYCLVNNLYVEYIIEWSKWFYDFRKAENMDIIYGEHTLDWLAYPHDTIVDIAKWFKFMRNGTFNNG